MAQTREWRAGTDGGPNVGTTVQHAVKRAVENPVDVRRKCAGRPANRKTKKSRRKEVKM